jgi:nitroimidazol reductase NimA-like FMN-containing flavoprotein (pyridoxamine 5'-phosphate oxidase superfamily)
MRIQELEKAQSLRVLARLRLGRIACCEAAQPYIVPFYFAYDMGYLYSFSTIGQKIIWMRANSAVCVQTDEIESTQEWVSLVILGRYEELLDTAGLKVERERAYELLQHTPCWWEPGYSKTMMEGAERPLVPVYFRIQILEITGRYTASAPGEQDERKTSSSAREETHSRNRILADLQAELL